MVLGLSYMSYGQFRKFGQSFSEVSFPKIEIPEMRLEEFSAPTAAGEEKEWVSPDGGLKLAYSSRWTEADKMFLGYIDQTGIALTEAELLFFAHQIEAQSQAPAFLIVGKITEQKTFEEIMQEMEDKIKAQGGETEIITMETDNGTGWFEMVSGYPGQPYSYLKGKLLFSENITYLVVFTSYQTSWPKFEQEAQEILDLAQLVLISE
jgi:hypothetical protein